MQIREYLKAREGHAWRPEDTVWVEHHLGLIADPDLAARWRENAAWNAQARAEWEARQP